jgi:trimethylamine--corrinoid protein Co-methyltransferase
MSKEDGQDEDQHIHQGQPNARRRRLPEFPGGLPGGQYMPLTEKQIARIYKAALTVLEETGIQVFPSRCREIWREAGAKIDEERHRVFVPPELVAQGLSVAARQVKLCGQFPEYDLDLEGTRVYMGTGGTAVKVLDLDGQVRDSRLRDLFDIGRLVTALDNIHFYVRPVAALDIPLEALDLNTYYACLSATPKHVMGNCFTPESVEQVMKLGATIAGGEDALRQRPFISWIASWIVSPLRYAPKTVEVLDEVVRQGMPVVISSAPLAGATAPATLAGTLVQLTAEQLSGLTYINLMRPGHPVILGYVPSVADLRTGRFSGGGPEFALMNAAAAQIVHRFGLPVYNSAALTDSKIPDIQAGYERGLSGTTAALAGSNFIHHAAGFLEALLTVAYEQYVIDDDVSGSVMRMVRGIEVNDDTLSVSVIKEVCDGEGHFLIHPQTLQRMGNEYRYPHTGDRLSREDWERNGALDMRERAKIKARELLNSEWPTHIPDELDTRIRAEFEILLPRELMKAGGQSW